MIITSDSSSIVDCQPCIVNYDHNTVFPFSKFFYINSNHKREKEREKEKQKFNSIRYFSKKKIYLLSQSKL